MKVTNLNNYDYIIIVGLTGVGKSSLVQKMVSDYGMVIKKNIPPDPNDIMRIKRNMKQNILK